MANLQQIKATLSQLKTNRAIYQNKFDEAMAVLRDTYGIDDLQKAHAEYLEITEKTIPQLQLKRDNMLKKAEAILNGIDTQTVDNEGADPPGLARGRLTGGDKTRRQPVGLSRGN